MKKIITNGEFFSAKDTLECGQIFRFSENSGGRYFVNSGDKRCLLYNEGNNAVIECEDNDEEYFINFFDLERDYCAIVNSAIKEGGIIAECAKAGKGIRILNQNKTETLFSFIVSQNNNIPRIKGIIERLCLGAGRKKEFAGEEYYTFPTVEEMAKKPLDFYKKIGLGYRAEYVKRLADGYANDINEAELSGLTTAELKKRLLTVYGVGPKVADCVTLFGYHKSDSFPVDTWIEKVYKEDFNGELKDRKQIADYFVKRFGENSGYYQQYLFYYKRGL